MKRNYVQCCETKFFERHEAGEGTASQPWRFFSRNGGRSRANDLRVTHDTPEAVEKRQLAEATLATIKQQKTQ